MSKWIFGYEIVKEKGIDSLELVEYISKGLIQPYQDYHPIPPPDIQELNELRNELATLTRRLAFCRLDQSEQEEQLTKIRLQGKINRDRYIESLVAVQCDFTPEYVKDLEREIKVKQKIAALLEKKLSKKKNDSWAGYHLPDDDADKIFMINYLLNLQFKSAEVERVIKHHELDQRELDHTPTKRKLRPSQKDREKCKEVARKLREQNPTITIAAAIRHKDMKEVSKKNDGKFYLEDTIRGWIKTLWPDKLRKRGRKKGT